MRAWSTRRLLEEYSERSQPGYDPRPVRQSWNTWPPEPVDTERENARKAAHTAFLLRLSARVARAIYQDTRALNLPRAPLYGGKPPRAKQLPLGVLGKQGGYCFTNWTQQATPIKQRRARKACPHCGGAL